MNNQSKPKRITFDARTMGKTEAVREMTKEVIIETLERVRRTGRTEVILHGHPGGWIEIKMSPVEGPK